MPDGGSVEVVAEGPRASLEALLAQLRRGPPGSRVDAVEDSWTARRGAGRAVPNTLTPFKKQEGP